MTNKEKYQTDKYRQKIMDLVKDIYWIGQNMEEVDWSFTRTRAWKLLLEYKNSWSPKNSKCQVKARREFTG